MKKLLAALCITTILAIAAQAQDAPKTEGKRPAPTPEQKAARKALLEKYDTNKDGKLDKEEASKITPEEREKAGMPAHGKKHAK